ncbi:MAG TPA: hypothetical protein VGA01_12965 [Candidatus Binatia bacterium]
MQLIGSENPTQIEARRFCPLLGWELSGVRQRVPQGAFYWGYLLFSETSFCRQIIQSIGGLALSRTL